MLELKMKMPNYTIKKIFVTTNISYFFFQIRGHCDFSKMFNSLKGA